MDTSDLNLSLLFPRLTDSNYHITSPVTEGYNCIAWAAEDDQRWWWPTRDDGYWPPNAPRSETVESFVLAFKTLGYEVCDNGEMEEQCNKIALYVDDGGSPTHMARQLQNGFWTSKLGNFHDITHKDPYVVAEGVYGTVKCFLKKQR